MSTGAVEAEGGDGPTLLHVYTRQVRLESKIEQLIELMTSVRDQLTDHEARIRALEAGASGASGASKRVAETLSDHEKRLRSIETWARALPASTLIALVAAIASIVSAFLGN